MQRNQELFRVHDSGVHTKSTYLVIDAFVVCRRLYIYIRGPQKKWKVEKFKVRSRMKYYMTIEAERAKKRGNWRKKLGWSIHLKF